MDHREFVAKPVAVGGRPPFVPRLALAIGDHGQSLLEAGGRLLVERLLERATLLHLEIGELVLAEAHLEVAATCHVHRVVDGLRKLGEGRAHLLRRLDEELIGPEFPALRVGEGLSGLDAEQCLVSLRVAAFEVVAIVGRDERKAQVAGERDEFAVGCDLLGEVVVLDLDVVAIAGEDAGEVRRHLAGALRVAPRDRLVHLAREATGEAEEALVEFAQEFLVDAGLVVEALAIARRDQPAEVAIADLVLREQDQVEVPARLGIVGAGRSLVEA